MEERLIVLIIILAFLIGFLFGWTERADLHYKLMRKTWENTAQKPRKKHTSSS